MTLLFAGFTLDLDRRLLLREGTAVHLAPKAFDLLAVLIGRRPDVVSKQELFDELWPETFVTDNVLATLVADIRNAIGDTPRRPRLLKTAHGRGYVFDGEVVVSPARDTDCPCYLLVGGRRIHLCEGENILGRSSEGATRLDARTVSKRHARVMVTCGRVTVEDLGSKNGTWIGSRAVTSPTAVQSGDRLRLGRLRLTVCIPGDTTTTDTAVSPPRLQEIPEDSSTT